MPSWLRVRRRGWEIERGEDWFQMHTVGCVAPRAGIQHHRAVHLAFTGGVLGDVSDPQLVRCRPGELAVHQVTRGGCLVPGPGPAVAGQALDPSPAHQQFRRAVTNRHAQPQSQLSMDPAGPVDAARGHVDGLELPASARRVPHRPRRGCPGPATRNNPTRTPAAPGSPAARAGPHRRSPRSPRSAFWGPHIAEEL